MVIIIIIIIVVIVIVGVFCLWKQVYLLCVLFVMLPLVPHVSVWVL